MFSREILYVRNMQEQYIIIDYSITYVNLQKNKIKYIPMKGVLQKDEFIDGLHLNTNGHKKICE